MHNNDITSLLKLKGVNFINSYEEDCIIYLKFRREDKRYPCSCGSTKLHIHDWRTIILNDLPIHGKNVKIIVSKQRYRCVNCNARITSSLDFVDKGRRVTIRIIQYIINKLKKLNFKDTALEIGISITSVMREFKKYANFNNEYSEVPKIFHIDEFKGTSDAGKYQLALCDGTLNRLFDVLPDRNQGTLITYFNSLKGSPEICVIDMWLPFKRAIKKTWSNTIIVADKFHYVRQIQWAFKGVRIRIQELCSGNKILKKYWKLFCINTNNLTESQILRLESLLDLNAELKEAYYLKAFFDKHVTGNKKENAHKYFNIWLDMIKETKIPEFKNLEKTFKNWYSEVVASFYYDRTNALAEGINNRIKVTKRQSYGIRKFENLRNLLMLRIS